MRIIESNSLKNYTVKYMYILHMNRPQIFWQEAINVNKLFILTRQKNESNSRTKKTISHPINSIDSFINLSEKCDITRVKHMYLVGLEKYWLRFI